MNQTTRGEQIPVGILTGFLGSGKTTLLRRLLQSGASDTAVLVNEFGEIGIDHEIMATVAEDIVLLKNGCICCSIRGEIGEAIGALLARRQAGATPKFSRIVIETSGLAEPAPILATLLHDRSIRDKVRRGRVVVTVDAVNAALQAPANPQWSEQLAAADLVLLTKSDLVGPELLVSTRALVARIGRSASVMVGAEAAPLRMSDFFDWPDSEVWRDQLPGVAPPLRVALVGAGHLGAIDNLSLWPERELDWDMFALWLSLLLHRHGDSILRVKGLLQIAGQVGPVAIDGVQHIVHRPQHLDNWVGPDRRSRLVFIARNLDVTRIQASFEAVLGSATRV